MKNNRYMILLTLLSASFIFISCGGSSDSDYSDAKTETGVFIDSPVEGLKYSTQTLSGYTNSKGEFQYRNGEVIKFLIGNLELGSVNATSMISPLSLAGESDLNNIGVKATNIARILQTLGANTLDSGRLILPAKLQNLNISNINFESEADLNTLLSMAESITSINYILKDSDSAKNEMRYNLESHLTTSGGDTVTQDNNTTVLNGENTVNLQACQACHGQNFERNALGHSKIVKDMTKSQVVAALIGYKYGTYGGNMKGLMKGQIARYSDDEIRRIGIGR